LLFINSHFNLTYLLATACMAVPNYRRVTVVLVNFNCNLSIS
jgi:hypothetical protein